MARKKPVDPRVQAFVAAMLAERPHNEDEHINDIELAMEELADEVADEFATQLLARSVLVSREDQHAAASSPPICPHCGCGGQQVGERQREILTTRGSAPLVEPQCYCAACRRNFFPSVAASGTVA